jgi:hypothetical protein
MRMRFRPFKAFRTRYAGAVALDPLGLLAGLQRGENMRESRKPTACPECSVRVLSLRTSRGEKLLVDLPDPSRDPRHRASVTQDDDGRAIELREGQIPLEGRQAFVPHRLTCVAQMRAAAEAALDRMEDSGRRAVAGA